MTICENLGSYLNGIRKASGKSITELSDELGISRSSLQSILNGTGNPRSDTLEHIAARLGIDLSEALYPKPPSTTLCLTEQQVQDLLRLLDQFSDHREAAHE